ncbi:MAG TPA: IPT/TIG domain-containing protein, partial [Bryobacteraceae bacterium]|nr:IPT/TIG domain-containing protein [Bryobacteraceae bacterium]
FFGSGTPANNPAPAITSLAPSSATAGGAAFTLTVNGTGFVSGSSVVNWNGSGRPTTYLSATQLQAAITAADIGTVGTAQVTVFNPLPGGGTSGTFALPINPVNNPAPTITSLAPSSATAGGAAFTLTVNGTGFLSGSSVVNWNGSARATTYLSATQLQAAITAADIGAAGTAQVTVVNSPGGGTSGAFLLAINPANNPGTTASYVKTDTTTAGNWKGVYGADGFNVINDTVNYPSYVTVTPSANASYTWVPSTSDGRALQKALSTTDRIAACWYTGGVFTIDLKFNDTNTHQVALYFLDWDGGRSERVDILDASNNVLDTRTVSAFTAGEYLVWNVSGHVVARVTNTGSNAVVSGIFLSTPAASGGTASYVKTDTTTAGTWKGVYGSDGYNIINDTVNYPSYVTVTPSGNAAYTWISPTSDMRALQKASSATDRIAACWYTGGFFTIDLKFSDTNTHALALYLLDWDGGRSERVDILDAGNNLLDTRTVSAFTAGQYLVWNVSGHVVVRITNNGSNAVLSGIFFGNGGTVASPPSSGVSATYLKTDTTTAGTWKGVYGADGSNVINDTVNYPSYVTVTPAGNASYTWVSSTSDGRALQKASSATDRIAACWYTGGFFTIDLNISDTNTHQVALYFLDWDGGRSERVDILDTNNNVLDTRTVSGFGAGEYLVWNVSGHVVVRITNTASNAVVSGIFFR